MVAPPKYMFTPQSQQPVNANLPGKRHKNLSQIPERRGLSWIIQVSPKYHHMYSYKKETKGILGQAHRGKDEGDDDRMMEAKIGVM